jgi:hypothetical protein
MFFPDPDSGSRIRINLSILTQKIGFQALGNMIRDVHPGSGSRIMIFYPSRTLDPGGKKTSDPGSGTLILDALIKNIC